MAIQIPPSYFLSSQLQQTAPRLGLAGSSALPPSSSSSVSSSMSSFFAILLLGDGRDLFFVALLCVLLQRNQTYPHWVLQKLQILPSSRQHQWILYLARGSNLWADSKDQFLLCLLFSKDPCKRKTINPEEFKVSYHHSTNQRNHKAVM